MAKHTHQDTVSKVSYHLWLYEDEDYNTDEMRIPGGVPENIALLVAQGMMFDAGWSCDHDHYAICLDGIVVAAHGDYSEFDGENEDDVEWNLSNDPDTEDDGKSEIEEEEELDF